MRNLERQLDSQKDDQQKIILLDQIISYYAFTNVRKAQRLLSNLSEILLRKPNIDYKLKFHLYTAYIENQLYNYFLAEIHFKQSLEILEERGAIKELAEVYIDYAGTCINLDKMKLAITFLDKASKIVEDFPDEQLQARITCREGFLNLHYSNYAKAIEFLLEAEKNINASEQELNLKDYYFLTLIHSGLGRIYLRNDDIEKSVRAYLKVVNMCESLGMRTRLAWHYLNVGRGYMSMGDDESAENYFRKAIKNVDDISQHARASAYANLGHLYFRRQQSNEALRLYEKAENLYKEKSAVDYHNFSIIESWKARLYVATNKRKRANKHFIKAFEYAKKDNDLKQLANVCKDISAFYAELEDYKNAYDYQLLHDQITAKYTENLNRRTMLEMEVKYEVAQKRQEAELLRLQATELQLKALRAQMNPHFMYNALNSVQNYITSNELTSATKYLAKFAKLMRQSLEYSDLELISLEKEIEFLEDYLYINQKLRFEKKLEYKIRVDDELEEDIMGVPTMIVQPYVENAIEHGLRSKKSGMLKVEFSLHNENTILCVIEDNGVGRAKTKILQAQAEAHLKHRSRGTSITEERLELLNKSNRAGLFVKTIDLYDEQSGAALGTRVEVLLPIKVIQR